MAAWRFVTKDRIEQREQVRHNIEKNTYRQDDSSEQVIFVLEHKVFASVRHIT